MGFIYPPEPRAISFGEFLAVHCWRVKVDGEYRYHTSHAAAVFGLRRGAVVESVEYLDGNQWRAR